MIYGTSPRPLAAPSSPLLLPTSSSARTQSCRLFSDLECCTDLRDPPRPGSPLPASTSMHSTESSQPASKHSHCLPAGSDRVWRPSLITTASQLGVYKQFGKTAIFCYIQSCALALLTEVESDSDFAFTDPLIGPLKVH